MTTDYFAYPVLYVDDETPNLVAMRYALEETFTLLTASSGEEAMTLLRDRDVAVLLTDQRMPGMTGVQLCAHARDIAPDTTRILITAYADIHAAIDAVNSGGISQYVTKPFRNEELIRILRVAIDFVHVQRSVRMLQARLLQAGQTGGAQTIVSALAHELRNLLTAVHASSESLGESLVIAHRALGPGSGQVVRAVAEAADCQRDILNAAIQMGGVLDQFAPRRPRTADGGSRTDVARIAESCARLLRGQARAGIRIQVVTEGTVIVPLDPVPLGQVLLNLLINAAEAVTESQSRENVVVVRIARMGDQGVIEVSDSGPGIAPELVDRIFDPQFTTKPDGAGLGLAIVRNIVVEAGGSIEARSDLGRGTTFTVCLPALESRPPSTTPPR